MTSSSDNSYAASVYSASGYGALRGIASLCTGLGWLIVMLAGLSALLSLFAMANIGFVAGLAGIIASIVVGGFSFILLRVIAESISVLLDIEANTRKAALILDERLRVALHLAQPAPQPDMPEVPEVVSVTPPVPDLGTYIANLPTPNDNKVARVLQGIQEPLAYKREAAINEALHSKLRDPRIVTAIEILAAKDSNESIRGIARRALATLKQDAEETM